jgi:putative transposase
MNHNRFIRINLFRDRLLGEVAFEHLSLLASNSGMKASKNQGYSLIFHSDRGSQYASGDDQRHLKAFGMRRSMICTGDCWGNAVTETLSVH